MPEFKTGDRVTPIGWALPSPKPTGTVLETYRSTSGQRMLVIEWTDGRVSRNAVAVIKRAAEESKMPTWIVTITWPDDPERGMETYGPFATQEEQTAWVDACTEAAAAGWGLLEGAHYLLHRVIEPFDVDALWEVDGGSARNYGDPQEGDVVEYLGDRYMVRSLKWVDSVLTEARIAAGRTDDGIWVKTKYLTVAYREETNQEPVCRIPDCGCSGKVHS